MKVELKTIIEKTDKDISLFLQKALDEGTQDTTKADIGNLTQNLDLIKIKMDQQEKDDDTYKKLLKRYSAVSDKLEELETKTSSSP